MARKAEAERLLRAGRYPSEVARQMGVSAKTAIQYLRTQVGEGSLRLSDLYFSWPRSKREILRQATRKRIPDDRLLSAHGLCRDELELYRSLTSSSVFRGDLYEYVSGVEIVLHRLIRTVLQEAFGKEEPGWWRTGVPQPVRLKCVERHQLDEDPCDSPYAYTMLLDLSTIVAKHWKLFQKRVPGKYSLNLGQLKQDLARLNGIRNAVMHPVKEREWSDDDFLFVREVASIFGVRGANQPSLWRRPED